MIGIENRLNTNALTAIMVAVAILAFAWPSLALAYDETPAANPDCGACHLAPSDTTASGTRYGPHGHYLTTTSRCAACHSVHAAPANGHMLLPGETVKDSCLTCHDGTATNGGGVYGAIEARMGVGAVKSDHAVESTSIVPGGSAANGGSATMVFAGTGGTLTCTDCHSPHGANCVNPFLGERQRSWDFLVDQGSRLTVQTQNRLLKRSPGGASVQVTEYGSDWCAACHAGRVSGLATVHNHPVESALTKPDPADRYIYNRLGIVDVAPYPTASTVLGTMGINTKNTGYNRAYLMPYPRVGAQQNHLPICQQCHEDARNVGALDAAGTLATPSIAQVRAPDGRLFPDDNPRFQNFPHESTNELLLVETQDNLCLNCHPEGALP